MTTEAQRLAEELAHIDHERWDVLDRAARELRRIDFELACANNAIIARDDREDKHLAALRQAREALELVQIDCQYLHHAKKDRHLLSEPCPVEHRIRDTADAINELLGEQT